MDMYFAWPESFQFLAFSDTGTAHWDFARLGSAFRPRKPFERLRCKEPFDFSPRKRVSVRGVSLSIQQFQPVEGKRQTQVIRSEDCTELTPFERVCCSRSLPLKHFHP
jgi:hypothetical protein